MLINENKLLNTGPLFVMSDLNLLAASTKTTLLEIAKQAGALGIGLQNAAPAEKSDSPNNSIQYLLAIAETLVIAANECEALFLALQQASKNISD